LAEELVQLFFGNLFSSNAIASSLDLNFKHSFVWQFWGLPCKKFIQIPWVNFGMGLWAFATIITGKKSDRP